MRLLTWNINGIRTLPHYHPWSTLKTTDKILPELHADIICFQEMKSSRKDLDRQTAVPEPYDSFFSFPKSKGGYSGVAVYCDPSAAIPLKAEEGLSGAIQPKPPLSSSERISDSYPTAESLLLIGDEENKIPIPSNLVELDSEGRALVLDFRLFVLINTYCPNDASEARMVFKMNYHFMLQSRVQTLIDQGREVIVVGDMNVVAGLIDHGEGGLESKKAGFFDAPHRKWFSQWLVEGGGPMHDVVRRFWLDRQGMYTCWNTKLNARESNYGARIDYVLCTSGLLPWIAHGDIQPSIRGSDHCPVFIDFHDEIIDPTTGGKRVLRDEMGGWSGEEKERREIPRICARNWDEYSRKQTLLSSFFGPGKGKGGTLANAARKREEPAPSIEGSTATPTPTIAPSRLSHAQASSTTTPTPTSTPMPTPSSSSQAPLPLPLADLDSSLETSPHPASASTPSVRPLKRKLSASLLTDNVDPAVAPRDRDSPSSSRDRPVDVSASSSQAAASSSSIIKSSISQTSRATKSKSNPKSTTPSTTTSTTTTKTSTKAAPQNPNTSRSGTKPKPTKPTKQKVAPAPVQAQAKLSSFFSNPTSSSKHPKTGVGMVGQKSRSDSKSRAEKVSSGDIDVINVDEDEDDGSIVANAAPPAPTSDEGNLPVPFDIDKQQQLEQDHAYALSLSQLPPSPPPSQSSSSSSQPSKSSHQAKTAWAKLQLSTPLVPPLCTVHKEPAKKFVVNKSGLNKGKVFFVCSRPVGPGYDAGRSVRLREEVNREWKCDYFKWASDVRKEQRLGEDEDKGNEGVKYAMEEEGERER